MILSFLLRLLIWLLLSSDLSPLNIFLGVMIALILPNHYTKPEQFKDWLEVLKQLIVAIPQAFWEAIEIMIFPHNHEEMVIEKVKPRRSRILIFLDIFLITFTPKTIVTKYNESGWYDVHRITRRKNR